MKNLILIFLFILSFSVLSAATDGSSTSSSENGFIVTSNQLAYFVHTTIFDTKKKSLELIVTDMRDGSVTSRQTFTIK